MSINNNHNMLSTTNYKTSATTTANTTISNHTTGGTNTTSSCPSSPLAAAMVQQQQQQQQALKCPRCDSSNTKFCYYNNYSLSQPRHFCKACKRYWTRGGTLRNVPVGGGCRKNKRVKKAPATATTAAAAVTASNPKNSSLLSPLPPHSATTTTSDHLNSLFFDLLPNSAAAVASNLNLASTTSPFPTLPQMYDLQPQMSALGVRFSPQKFQLGFASSSLADLQQPGSSLLNSYQPPYDQELRVETNGTLELPKQVKEEGKNNVNGSDDGVGIEWQDQDPYYNMSQFDVAATNIAAAGVGSGDSSYLYWSSAILGGGAGWPDIANSSIAPMI